MLSNIMKYNLTINIEAEVEADNEEEVIGNWEDGLVAGNETIVNHMVDNATITPIKKENGSIHLD